MNASLEVAFPPWEKKSWITNSDADIHL